jgi:hypothetical protein
VKLLLLLGSALLGRGLLLRLALGRFLLGCHVYLPLNVYGSLRFEFWFRSGERSPNPPLNPTTTPTPRIIGKGRETCQEKNHILLRLSLE